MRRPLIGPSVWLKLAEVLNKGENSMKHTKSKRDTIALLDSILFSTKFSGRTKSLYAYFTQGKACVEKPYGAYCRRINSFCHKTFMERAEGNTALALYILNMKQNGAWFVPTVDSTRPATLARWETAVRLLDSARAQLRI